jgi:hypothetical protein
MKTSDRKNAKRSRRLEEHRAIAPKRSEAMKTSLLRSRSAVVWRKVQSVNGPTAGSLAERAERFGLGEELAAEVVRVVRIHLDGPVFMTTSVAKPRGHRGEVL